MSLDQALRAQDWKKIRPQLLIFTHHRLRKRSWELAEELAQDAIRDAFEHRGGWDPEKEPALDYLKRMVLNRTANENKRRRYTSDVVLDEDRLDALIEEKDTLEETHEKRRLLESVYARLTAKLEAEKDKSAEIVLALIVEEIATPREQEQASGLSHEQVMNARRRIFYFAARVAAEIANEERRPQGDGDKGAPHGND